MVEINSGHRRPLDVIAVGRVAELRSWSYDAGTTTLRIGAGVTYAELEGEHFRHWVPALSQAARTVGSPQIRHVATIGGNVATCSPAGDGLPVLAALDAVVHLVSVDGARSMPFGEFMIGPKRTALLPGELIEAISVPVFGPDGRVTPRSGSATQWSSRTPAPAWLSMTTAAYVWRSARSDRRSSAALKPSRLRRRSSIIAIDRSPTRMPPSSPVWPRRRPGRSTTTARLPSIAVTQSQSCRDAC